ncbi:BZ3500_MvSof-1268-A1-R1_Chr7-3g09595 [Microbotryum saponariae]|uniref:BZ3500_MvSof-1268-A1-R1_Chr7-3g09595 protein n=1 Tax=Microbotryum saponariae TaxID=289078 RepID=A0A2X0L0H2_9BASI|nr:BZ3501_MvSof-1269-A2-R1_Chr7-2g09318 [Microbotryum saponariae]SDA02258.1 BZ3500_MvSof-1268-A1-R1_Chr7-3g09595 [Microbotryum saponariae]
MGGVLEGGHDDRGHHVGLAFALVRRLGYIVVVHTDRGGISPSVNTRRSPVPSHLGRRAVCASYAAWGVNERTRCQSPKHKSERADWGKGRGLGGMSRCRHSPW